MRDDNSGTYAWKGEKYPSVTTILKDSFPKVALINWGIYAVADGVVAIMDEINTITLELTTSSQPKLEADVTAWQTHRKELIDRRSALHSKLQDRKALAGIPYGNRDKKAAIGSAVHKLADSATFGADLESADPAIKGHAQAIHSFNQDFKCKVIASECMVLNKVYGYAGTLDKIIEVSDEEATAWGLDAGPGNYVLDYKTGKGTYFDHALQMNAYSACGHVCVGIEGTDDGEEFPMPEIIGSLILLAKDDGKYELYEWPVSDDNLDIFLNCVEMAKAINAKPTACFRTKFAIATKD